MLIFLGFDNTEFVFQQQTSRMVKTKEIEMIKGSHVFDKSTGLNFIFLECDKIKNVIVGFERQQTMLIAPLKWYDPLDDHMIESYSPINHERKLVSGIIHNLYFKVLDIDKNKIIFDSGKILLNAMVSKGVKN